MYMYTLQSRLPFVNRVPPSWESCLGILMSLIIPTGNLPAPTHDLSHTHPIHCQEAYVNDVTDPVLQTPRYTLPFLNARWFSLQDVIH